MALALPVAAHVTSGLHWETMHVYHEEPTQIFDKLGLTHSTRYGHTLGQKRVPDPTFPPGLTDVVPYDTGHALLVRGTTEGLAAFRTRVSNADVPESLWRLSVTLLRNGPDGGAPEVVAGQTKDVAADAATAVEFDSGSDTPEYRITVHLNRDGTLRVTRQTSLSLLDATIPAAASSGAVVFVPASVWTKPITQDVRPGDELSFSDLATDRTQARAALAVPAEDPGADYTVQIQITPAPAFAAGDHPLAQQPNGPASE